MQARSNNDAIFTAIDNQDIDLIKKLVDEGINLTIPNKNGSTPIEYASKKNYWDCVQAIAKSRTADHESNKISTHNDDAKYGSALLNAVEAESFLTITILLENAKVTSPWTKVSSRNSAIHIAAMKGNQKILSLLLKHKIYGKDGAFKYKNSDRKTAIELAADSHHYDIVEYLIKKGMKQAGDDPSDFIKKAHFAQVLSKAAEDNNYYIVNLLLHYKVPCNKTDQEHGHIGLYWAIKHNNAVLFTLLLENGADPSIRKKDSLSMSELAAQSPACKAALLLFNQSKQAKQQDNLTNGNNKIDQLKACLMALQMELAGKTWLVKSFSNLYWDYHIGKPNGVKAIETILDQMNFNDGNDIFKSFAKILNILANIKPGGRHPDTDTFYKEKYQALQDISTDNSIAILPIFTVLNPLMTGCPVVSAPLYTNPVNLTLPAELSPITASITQLGYQPPSYQEVMQNTLSSQLIKPNLYPDLAKEISRVPSTPQLEPLYTNDFPKIPDYSLYANSSVLFNHQTNASLITPQENERKPIMEMG